MISGCDILHARLLFLYCNENYFNFAILKNKLYLSPSVGKKLEIERRKQINKWLLTGVIRWEQLFLQTIFFFTLNMLVLGWHSTQSSQGAARMTHQPTPIQGGSFRPEYGNYAILLLEKTVIVLSHAKFILFSDLRRFYEFCSYVTVVFSWHVEYKM